VLTNITSIKETGSGAVYVGTGPFAGSGSGNGVYLTNDSGRTWSQRGLLFTSVTSMDLFADSILLAGTATGQVYEGTVSSTQWTLTPSLPIGGSLHFAQFYSYASTPLKEVAGLGARWYQRDARSQSGWWEEVFPPFEPTYLGQTPPSSFGEPSVVPGGLDVGTYGGGVYRSIGPLTWVRSGPEARPQDFLLEQNYPNPFNPTTTIRYGLPQRSLVTLAVYNTLGQEVATLVNGEKEAGYHEVVFDASGLASGVYLYRLTTGSFSEMRKVLLLK
jgi:hypothetical protein